VVEMGEGDQTTLSRFEKMDVWGVSVRLIKSYPLAHLPEEGEFLTDFKLIEEEEEEEQEEEEEEEEEEEKKKAQMAASPS
jgi:hypothetical protein